MSGQPEYADEERVVGTQARALKALRKDNQATTDLLDDSIARAEALAARLGASLPALPATSPTLVVQSITPPPFVHLVAAAAPEAGLQDALDVDEIETTLARLHAAGKGPDGTDALDRWDWAVAGAAGLLAGIADLVLVGFPRNPLTQFGSDGGPLPNAIHSAFGRILPPDTVVALEKAYPVPYDFSTNNHLLKPVSGLYPAAHRFQSPGHDPLLGWFFGVRDVFNGTFTAIGRDGVVVIQQHVVEGTAGQGMFCGLLEAFRQVGGHMLSDVATPMGLPAPLMPLAQLLQFGSLGPEGLSIAETARRMYLQGYDFRHFAAGGLTAMIVEVIVRGAWVARRLHEGCPLQHALPNAALPRLRRQLLLAHATAAAVNAGKIALTQNPLALNWAQWLALMRYLAPELAHIMCEPAMRAAAQDGLLDADLHALTQGAHPRITFFRPAPHVAGRQEAAAGSEFPE